MKIIGIILIVLGLVGLVLGGITYTDTVLDVGPLEVEAEQEKTIPITPLAAGVALIAGIGLVVLDRKNKG